MDVASTKYTKFLYSEPHHCHDILVTHVQHNYRVVHVSLKYHDNDVVHYIGTLCIWWIQQQTEQLNISIKEL